MNRKIPYILTGCLSAALFYIFYGFRVLNPLYIDWLLLEGDPGQHYLGWALFRNTPFRFNFGLTNALAYPFSTSVIFTDSIPIMAVPCKIIGQFTRTQFQYFGIWALMCVILMGVLTCFLLNRYIGNPIVLTLSSLLITVSPCMLKRLFWHTSLGAHFLIIIGLILIAYRRELCDNIKHTVLWWGFLGFLCSFIHIYFLAMNAMLLLAFICFKIIDRTKDSSEKHCIISCIAASLSFAASSALSVWLLGGFSSGMANGAPGLAYYSFNLNGFLNPQGWSVILHDLPLYTGGQYEGFSYFGLGMLTATGIAFIAGLIRYLRCRRLIRDYVPYLICGSVILLLITILSSSNEISMGNRLLLSFELPEHIRSLWDIFRACGRLIWPVVYIICLFAIFTLSRSMRTAFSIILLTLCIILQFADLKNVIRDTHLKYERNVVYKNRLSGDFIDDLSWQRNLKHIVFLDKDNLSQEELYSFAEFAARKKLTINDFYFARALEHPVDEVALDFFMHPAEDTLYVISDESYEMRYMFDLSYYKYGDLSLGLKSPL